MLSIKITITLLSIISLLIFYFSIRDHMATYEYAIGIPYKLTKFGGFMTVGGIIWLIYMIISLIVFLIQRGM